MTMHDEFLEILRILAEDPRLSAKKPPEADHSANTPDISPDCANRERQGTAS